MARGGSGWENLRSLVIKEKFLKLPKRTSDSLKGARSKIVGCANFKRRSIRDVFKIKGLISDE